MNDSNAPKYIMFRCLKCGNCFTTGVKETKPCCPECGSENVDLIKLI